MFKPNARPWPARSVRASISRASGSCAANVFSRRRRRNSNHISGNAPMAIATAGSSAGWRCSRTPRAAPTTAMTSEIAANLATVRFVSACWKRRSRLPNRSRNVSTMLGLSSSGWERMLVSFAGPSLPAAEGLRLVNWSSRSSTLLPDLSRNSIAPPPTIAATPKNTTTASKTGLDTQSSNMTRSRNALDGRRTPAASSRAMNTGRTPVAMNLP